MKEKKTICYPILKRDFLIVNIVAGLGVLLMALSLLFRRVGILPDLPCPLHEFAGLYCPGCGGTRAFRALLRGHILDSLWCNPLLLVGIILALHYEIGVLVTLIKRNGKKYYIASPLPAYFYLAFVFIFAIIRDVALVVFQFDMLHDFIP